MADRLQECVKFCDLYITALINRSAVHLISKRIDQLENVAVIFEQTCAVFSCKLCVTTSKIVHLDLFLCLAILCL